MTRQSHNSNVECKVLATELCPDSTVAGDVQHLCFEFSVPEGPAMLIAARRQIVVVLRRCQLHRLHCCLGRCAADDKGEVIWRAGSRPERHHFFGEKFDHRLGIPDGPCLLIEEGLICRPPPLGDKQEIVGISVDGRDVQLRGQVTVGVLFVPHRERSVLRVPQIIFGISVVNTPRERCFIANGPDGMSLFPVNDRCARVLAERQDSSACHVGVLKHCQCNHPIIL